MGPPIEPLAAGAAQNLRYDVPAGLVVFLVALPLCLGIALASDAPLLSGVVAGVVGGLVIGPLSGSQLAVSGPAAGLTALVAAGIADLGSFEVFLAAVVLSGGIQVALGLARAGVLANMFPVSVIKGMLAGIGIILVLKQLPHALGRDADYEGDEGFWLLGHQANSFTEIEAALLSPEPGVVCVAVACLSVLWIWEKWVVQRVPTLRLVPGALVAVIVGVLLNEGFAFAAPSVQITQQAHLVNLPVMGFGQLLSSLPSPDFSRIGDPEVWRVAATLAVIGSLETLLSLEATDKLDPYRRLSSTQRELFAQGVGNGVSGLLGGLPITAVIVRSSANIQAGARTRSAAVVHGALLVVSVVAAPSLLNHIPLAALAAILLTVGYKLTKIELFTKMYASGVDQFVPFLITVVGTVLSDLLTGVLLGLAAGALLVLVTNYVSAISVVNDADRWLIRFTKDVSFLNKTHLRRVLAQLPKGADVVIDGHRAEFIDHDISEMIQEFADVAAIRGIQVELRGLESKPFPLRLPGGTP